MREAIRILYVDDDVGIGRLVQKHLEREGCVVTLAHDAEAGLRLARHSAFDAMALDHYMPGRDGLDMLADIQAMDEPPPVIFVTAAEESRVAVAALKQGAADFVVKDVEGTFLDVLSTAIHQAIERVQLRRERARAEEELRAQRDRLEQLASQQAILLQEVNHRVANSLQLISSLIELQARRVPDESASEILRRASERVEAVSLVHRRLYTSGDVSGVEMDQYLMGLVEELRRMNETEGGHEIKVAAAPIRMATDTAVPLGLIVNELVTNAVKYAYPNGVSGQIRVRLERETDQRVMLVVEDDGIGFPDEKLSPRGSGLGSMIVIAMAKTVRGEIHLDREHKGTRFIVRLAG